MHPGGSPSFQDRVGYGCPGSGRPALPAKCQPGTLAASGRDKIQGERSARR